MRALPILVLLLAAACSSSSPSTATPAGTRVPVSTHSAPPNAAPAPAPKPAFAVTTVAGSTRFTTPDRAVSCDLEAVYARCDVRPHSWTSTPQPPDCLENWGFGVEYQLASSAGFFCAADSVLGATRVLAVGQALRFGMVECDSTATGIRCLQTGAADGFLVSKSSYRFF